MAEDTRTNRQIPTLISDARDRVAAIQRSMPNSRVHDMDNDQGRMARLADALQASEAERARLEAGHAELVATLAGEAAHYEERAATLAAVIAELGSIHGFESGNCRCGLPFHECGLAVILSRVGDPVVLREHDAKVLRDAAEAHVRPTYRAVMLTGVDQSGVLAGNEALHRAADRLDRHADLIEKGAGS